MSRALSDDLHRRVIEAMESGMSRREAPRRFGIGMVPRCRALSATSRQSAVPAQYPM